MTRISWAHGIIFGMMAGGAVLLLGHAQEGHATGTFTRYASSRPQLPVAFEYPADWSVEESSGTYEAYSQVQIYGPESLESRLRTYLVVRSMPPKTDGGRYTSVREMVDAYRQTLQPGLRIAGEQQIAVSGVPAIQLDISGTLRLPWESQEGKLVPVTSQRIFFERQGRFYEAGWMGTPEVSDTVAAVFAHLLQTLTLVQ